MPQLVKRPHAHRADKLDGGDAVVGNEDAVDGARASVALDKPVQLRGYGGDALGEARRAGRAVCDAVSSVMQLMSPHHLASLGKRSMDFVLGTVGLVAAPLTWVDNGASFDAGGLLLPTIVSSIGKPCLTAVYVSMRILGCLSCVPPVRCACAQMCCAVLPTTPADQHLTRSAVATHMLYTNG